MFVIYTVDIVRTRTKLKMWVVIFWKRFFLWLRKIEDEEEKPSF